MPHMKSQLIILLSVLSAATLAAQPNPVIPRRPPDIVLPPGLNLPALQRDKPASRVRPDLVIPIIFPHPAPQLDTVTSHNHLYFPQLADGGNATSKWQTTLTFVNLSTMDDATVYLWFYSDPDGSPWSIDFGACGTGPTSELILSIPPRGMKMCQSQVSSPAVKVGWAYGVATVPVQATASFRTIIGGVPAFEVSAEPTLPTWRYTSFANRNLGIAIANPSSDTISVILTAYDSGGSSLGDQTISLPANNHISNGLTHWFPGLPSDFAGSVTLTGADPSSDAFIAWTLNSFDGTVISTLPQGRAAWPLAPLTHWDQVWRAFRKVWVAAVDSGYNFLPASYTMPTLNVVEDLTVNAVTPDANTIQISEALSQLISDSPGELAFVLGHQMGHLYQMRNGGAQIFNPDIEVDADVWGVFLTALAGYDVYSATGALVKEAAATGYGMSPGGFDGWADPNDAYTDITSRLQNSIGPSILQACNVTTDTDVAAICLWDRAVGHSYFPAAVPFAVHPKPKK